MSCMWITSSTAATLVPGRVSGFYGKIRTSPATAAALRRIEDAFQAERPEFRNISQRTVHIPSNAFNAGTAFTSFFAATTIVGDVLVAKSADDLNKTRVCAPDKRAEHDDHMHVAAAIQGWPKQGFGAFIYNFLRDEINDHGGKASVGRHAFYVYNPTTSADVVFKEKVRRQPLPSSFGGFSSDIEAIFSLMWANRHTMRNTMPEHEADAVVFHLLVLAMGTMAVVDRMVISESIGRLVIRGHMEGGRCYASFNFVWVPPQVTLHEVRNLDTDAKRRLTETPMLAMIDLAAAYGWAGAMYNIFWLGNVWFGLCLCMVIPWVQGIARRMVESWFRYIPPRILGTAPDDIWNMAAWELRSLGFD